MQTVKYSEQGASNIYF